MSNRIKRAKTDVNSQRNCNHNEDQTILKERTIGNTNKNEIMHG